MINNRIKNRCYAKISLKYVVRILVSNILFHTYYLNTYTSCTELIEFDIIRYPEFKNIINSPSLVHKVNLIKKSLNDVFYNIIMTAIESIVITT